jgi:hypothetical protein
MLQPDHPLPPYRYVPGRAPHPIKHPDGHAYGRPEPRPDWPDDGSWASCELHRRALDLFNHTYWWEAHEAWEVLWHLAPAESPERKALSGLIQAAAYRLKRAMGNDRAAAALLEKSRGNLTAAASCGRAVLAVDCSGVSTSLDRDEPPLVLLQDARDT